MQSPASWRGAAFAAHPKIAADLDTTARRGTVDVIVQFADAPSEWNHQKVSRRRGKLKRHLNAANGALYSIQASELEALADDPDVVAIHPDREVHGNTTKLNGSAQSPTAKLVNGKATVVLPTGSVFTTAYTSTSSTVARSLVWGNGGTSGTSLVWGDATLRTLSALSVLTVGE